MGSKGARVVILPVYVVNIGLLYTLLLTSGLMLAWVTIYRHEKSISELQQQLKIKQTEDEKQLSAAVGTRGDQETLDEDWSDSNQQLLLEEDESNQRSRRNEDSGRRQDYKNTGSRRDSQERQKKRNKKKGSRKNKGKRKCRQCLNGDKGDKGDRGNNGDRGPPGYHGQNGQHGQQGNTGQRGEDGPKGEPGKYGQKGATGTTGSRGAKGEDGISGTKGPKGEDGIRGAKGSKGKNGIPGGKGSKGDQGPEGQAIMYSESAHIVGSEKAVLSSRDAEKKMYTMTSWTLQHRSGNMSYKNGYLTVGIDGVYFIYSQIFYCDGNSSYTGYDVYIDDRKALKVISSIISRKRKFQTQYTSGIFRINKGQRISIATSIIREYYLNESSSFFGAFMLHR